jgi:PDZ domain-containing protein
MNVSTEASSVPAGSTGGADAVAPPTGPREGRRWLWWSLGGALLVLSALVLAMFTVQIPYYEFRPGSARPTAPGVVVEGAESYPPASEISFTTVSLSRSTLASYVAAWFDDDVEVVDEAVILGDRSPDENRQFNLQLMDTSKQEAIRVALLALGYEVPIYIDGLVIMEVLPGSAAEGVLSAGETIVAIDGRELTEATDVGEIMDGRAPGDQVSLEVEAATGDARRTVDLVLGENPDEPERGIIGVSLQARSPRYDYPFEIDIDSGDVGGPSAGLAFSLGVLDVLTPGELTGGNQVAVTGTIDGNGRVGEVGGVAQKTAVVVDEGYDVFLVPSSEFEEAAERAGDHVRVIAVDTLEEALDALESLGGSGLGPVSQSG